jgi:5'-3' exonuclease
MITLLIDGNNLAHRARHVFRLSNGGQSVSVTYGFMHTLQSYIRRFKPTSIVVCWDGGTPEYRRARVPEYKANRHHGDDPDYPDFMRQVNELCDYVFPMAGIISVRKAGAEADDLMYHASKILAGDKIIITSDKDLFQAISPDDHTTVFNPAKDKVYTKEVFEEEYDIPLSEFLDWKAMIGDNSDNIPGIPGIGEKTATTLFKTFGILTNIIHAAEGCYPDKSLKISSRIQNSITSFGFKRIVDNVYIMALYADRTGSRRAVSDAVKRYIPANISRVKHYLLKQAFVSMLEEFPAQLSRLTSPTLKPVIYRMPTICGIRRPVK